MMPQHKNIPCWSFWLRTWNHLELGSPPLHELALCNYVPHTKQQMPRQLMLHWALHVQHTEALVVHQSLNWTSGMISHTPEPLWRFVHSLWLSRAVTNTLHSTIRLSMMSRYSSNFWKNIHIFIYLFQAIFLKNVPKNHQVLKQAHVDYRMPFYHLQHIMWSKIQYMLGQKWWCNVLTECAVVGINNCGKYFALW